VANRPQRGLGPGAHAELGEAAAQVGFDGAHAEKQRLADTLVGQPSGKQPQ
jgi:hypothetical protein